MSIHRNCHKKEIVVTDHIGNFKSNLTNDVLDSLHSGINENEKIIVYTDYILPPTVANLYPKIKFKYNTAGTHQRQFNRFCDYNIHPKIEFKKFISCFNGTNKVGRRFLTVLLKKYGWFNEYCSKNFVIDKNVFLGHLYDYFDDPRFYLKFFSLENNSFYNQIQSFGHIRFDYEKNIKILDKKITQTFLHIVSETHAEMYQPLITEKFLYSVVTRGLFVAYAQPNWHYQLENFFGFKLYKNIFNYEFDKITNPVIRLLSLTDMLSKFSELSIDDWNDLYLMEQDTIEHNYEHYFSGNYLKHLAQFE